MSPLVMPVIISYKSYPWIRVGLQSFRRHFPSSPILVIDNTPDPGRPGYEAKVVDERHWLDTWCAFDPYHIFLKTKSPDKRHGLAMDFAAQWCRGHGIPWMLHFEPDCLITGVEWARKLTEVIDQGIWMAGSYKKSYGPIHPTPSIWDVRQLKSSFEAQLRGADENHPRFRQLMDMASLRSQVTDKEWLYWGVYWDTAQKPWFDAASQGKDLLVDGQEDFQHFWQGSTHNPNPRSCPDSRVMEYL